MTYNVFGGTLNPTQSINPVTVVDIGAVTVQTSHSVKSLGVTIDDTLSFISQHVDNVCNAIHFYLRALRHI